MIEEMLDDSNTVKIIHELKNSLILNQTTDKNTRITTTTIHYNNAYHRNVVDFINMLTFPSCVQKLILHNIHITTKQLHEIIEMNSHLKTIVFSGEIIAAGWHGDLNELKANGRVCVVIE
jgi:hypothetical protein